MLIKVEFAAFGMDTEKNIPLLILKEVGGTRVMPLPVGALEASAIAIETLKIKAQKPLTIDVAKSILEQFDGTLIRVILSLDVQEYLTARLDISMSNKRRVIECRPCDAIALALRVGAPVYAHEAALIKYCRDGDAPPEEMLRSHIASLDTLEFGTYHLE